MGAPPPAGTQGTERPLARWLRRLRLPVTAVLLAWLAIVIDLGEALRILGSASIVGLLLVLLLQLFDRVFLAFRWHMLLQGEHSRVGFLPVLRLVFVSGFMSLFLPAGVGAEAVRVYGLARSTADLALALSSVLVERLIAFAALLLLVLLGLMLAPAAFPGWLAPAAWLGMAGLGLGSVALMLRPVRRLSFRLLPGRMLAPVRHKLDEVYARLDDYRGQRPRLALAMVVGIAFQLQRVLIAVVAGWAIGIDAAFTTWLIVVPIVSFITMLPISVAGLGVAEIGFIHLLGLVGIPAEQAFTLSISIFLTGIVASLPGALLYMRGGVARVRV